MKNHPILMKFGTLSAYSKYWTRWQSRDQKLKIFKIQGGGRPPCWKSLFGHNSSTDHPISTKFCMRKQNAMRTKATWYCQFRKSKMGTAPFWKALNRHISVKNCPILMKFSVLHQILYPMTVTWAKIKIFNIQDGGRSSCLNLEIAFWAISRQPIVRFQQTRK